jgi:hypothetical protein
MYQENDVLNDALVEVFEHARTGLGSKWTSSYRPQYGNLDVEQMRDAEYAFA